jgi:hypothetical protein
VKEWRVDTAHPRHTRSGCHTTAIRFRERSTQGDFLCSALITKRGFGVLSEFDT